MHLYIQFIIAVKYQQAQINSAWQTQLHEQIQMLCKKQRCDVHAINSRYDHLHCLVNFTPSTSMDKLITGLQAATAGWINEQNLTNTPFEWQQGYAAVSEGLEQLPRVKKYIQDQDSIHQQKSFLEEYVGFLKAYKIEYDPEDIFKPLV